MMEEFSTLGGPPICIYVINLMTETSLAFCLHVPAKSSICCCFSPHNAISIAHLKVGSRAITFKPFYSETSNLEHNAYGGVN